MPGNLSDFSYEWTENFLILTSIECPHYNREQQKQKKTFYFVEIVKLRVDEKPRDTNCDTVL